MMEMNIEETHLSEEKIKHSFSYENGSGVGETCEDTVPKLQTRPLFKRLYEYSSDERKRTSPNISHKTSESVENEKKSEIVDFSFVACKIEPSEDLAESGQFSEMGDLENNNQNAMAAIIKNEVEDIAEENIKQEPPDVCTSDYETQQREEVQASESDVSRGIPAKQRKFTEIKRRTSKRKTSKKSEEKEWEVELDIPQEIKIGVPDRRRTVKLISEEEASRLPNLIPIPRKFKTEPGTEVRRGKKKCFPCKDCSEVFQVHTELKAHSITHQVETRHKCQLCSKCFTRAHDLTLHRRVHSGEKPYPCTYCEKRFTQKINMLRHIRIHTHERPFACPMCGEGYIDQGELAKHVRHHTGALPFFCVTCKERFPSQLEVNRHSLRDHGTTKGLHVCAVCGAAFPDRTAKKEHLLLMHSESRPFQCDHCGKSFKLKVHLINHMSVHTGRRSHWCDVCGKSFSGESGRKLHMLRHAGLRPFPCRECGRHFHSRGLLARHSRAHSAQRPYTCQICGLTFKSSDSRRRHVKVVHERALHEYKCDFAGCTSTYSVKSNMHRHMRSFHYGMKPYQCPVCNGRFTSNSSLASHTKAKHTAIRDHHCQLCPNRFIDLKSLKRHLRLKHFKKEAS